VDADHERTDAVASGIGIHGADPAVVLRDRVAVITLPAVTQHEDVGDRGGRVGECVERSGAAQRAVFLGQLDTALVVADEMVAPAGGGYAAQ
jgi:hypothetical protein